MSAFDELRDDAEKFAKDHPDEAKKYGGEAVQQGGEAVDEATDNKYDQQVQQGEDFVEKKING